MPSHQPPKQINPRDRIPASWLREIARSIVQRITVRGGTVSQIGTSICIDLGDGRNGGRGESRWFGEIVNAGPDSEADVTGAAYWVREVDLTVDSGNLTYATKTDGRHVVAYNLTELGLGTSEYGLHGLMPTAFPAGITEAPPRIVEVRTARDSANELIYLFESQIGAYWSGRFVADVRTLDEEGCPDTYRWDQVGLSAVIEDTDVGDDMEEA